MSEVTDLKKAGKLEEAKELALKNLSQRPNDIWAKRDYSWVIYYYMSNAIVRRDIKGYVYWLSEVRRLNPPCDDDWYKFNELACAKLNSFLWGLIEDEKHGVSYLRLLFDEIEKWDNYSPIFSKKTLVRLWWGLRKSSRDLVRLVEWLGLDNFEDEDFNKTYSDKGKEYLPFAESITKDYIDAIMAIEEDGGFMFDKSKIEDCVRNVEELLKDERCENWEWMIPYKYGKLLISTNRRSEAQAFLAKTVLKKPNEFWTWQVFGESLREDSEEKYYACLFKGLLVSRDTGMANKLHKEAMHYFEDNNFLELAKYEAELVKSCRDKEGWSNDEDIERFLVAHKDVECADENSVRKIYEKNSNLAIKELEKYGIRKIFYLDFVNLKDGTVWIVFQPESLSEITETLYRERVKLLERSCFFEVGETYEAIFDSHGEIIIGDIKVCPQAEIRNIFIREQFGIIDSFVDKKGSLREIVLTPTLSSEEDIFINHKALRGHGASKGHIVRVTERKRWYTDKNEAGEYLNTGKWIWQVENLEEYKTDGDYLDDMLKGEFYVDKIDSNSDRAFIGTIGNDIPGVLSPECLVASTVHLKGEIEEHSVYRGGLFGHKVPQIVGYQEKITNCSVCKNVEGIYEVNKKGWGLIGYECGVVVPPEVVDATSIQNGSTIRATAYLSFFRDRKSQNKGVGSWKWKAKEGSIEFIKGPVIENFEGEFRLCKEGFGFVNDDESDDSCFVSNELVKKNELEDYDYVELKAIETWIRNKRTEGWSAVEILNKWSGEE